MSSSRVFLALCLCLSSSSSLAAPNAGVSVNNPTTVSFDRNNTFGWRFTPVTDIDVTALGYSDASSLPGGTGAGLSQPHEVGIYRVSDQALIADATVPAGTGGTLGGNFRYVQLPSPARLTGGTTYLMAGFGLSVTPDPAVATAQWTMAAGILYANAPTPTLANPTTGTSQYLVSAHGSPPAVLTYPALEQTAILPVFAANFQFTAPAPQLTIQVTDTVVVIGVTGLMLGTTNVVEGSSDLVTWLPLQSFVSQTIATNLPMGSPTGMAAFYRVKVLP